jgi:hypothetical protein
MRQNRGPVQSDQIVKLLRSVQALEMFQSFEKGAVRREGRKIKDESGKRKVKRQKVGSHSIPDRVRARPWNRLTFSRFENSQNVKTSQVRWEKFTAECVIPTKLAAS